MSDVLVVGGGPAGCAAALGCVEAGLAVTLLESRAFPRDRPGETLHPGLEPIFRRLGVLDGVLAAGFPRHEGNWVRWGGPLRFDAFGTDASGPWLGFQAWRADLDALLLEHARRTGVEILQPCRALGPLVRGDRVHGVLTGQGELSARFVVDASGGGHWLAKRLELPVERRSPRLIAHYGYAQDTEDTEDTEDAEDTEGTCPDRDASPVLSAGDDGWTWTAQVRPHFYQWTRLSLSGREPEGGWTPAELRALKPVGRARGADVTWRRVRPAAGPGYYLAGDAAAVLDPASSHGVLKALMSGMLAAHRIVQTVRAGVPEERAARSYDDWVRDGFEHDVGKLDELYTVLPAWKRRLDGKENASTPSARP